MCVCKSRFLHIIETLSLFDPANLGGNNNKRNWALCVMSQIACDTLNQIIEQAPVHVVYSGAGMSLAAGIPTFRGPGGLWVLPLYVLLALIAAHAAVFGGMVCLGQWTLLQYCVVAWGIVVGGLFVYAQRTKGGCILWVCGCYEWLITGGIWYSKWRWLVWILYNLTLHRHIVRAEPTSGHYFFAELSKRADTCVITVTQNVDGLEVRAGMDPDNVVQLHGSAGGLICTNPNGSCTLKNIWRSACGVTTILDKTGRVAPLGCPNAWRCKECGERRFMRTACLLFRDFRRPLLEGEGERFRYAQNCFSARGIPSRPTERVYWMIGTSNKVNKTWRGLLKFKGATVIEINPDPEPKFRELAKHHRYIHLQEKQEVVFDILRGGGSIQLPRRQW